MKSKSIYLSILSILSMVGCSITAQAGSVSADTKYYAFAGGNYANGVGAESLETCAGCIATLAGSFTVYDYLTNAQNTGAVSGSAVADYGVLKSYAQDTTTRNAGVTLSSTAKFTDQFVIDSTGRTGQVGSIVIPMSFVWNLASDGGGSASSSLDISFSSSHGGSATTIHKSQWWNGTTLVTQSTINGVAMPFDFDFDVLLPIYFGFDEIVSVTLNSSSASSGSQSATADAAHSYYWGGFESVNDSGGNAVSYSQSSRSGTDWSKSLIPTTASVPEPATGLLTLVAALALGATSRRKQ